MITIYLLFHAALRFYPASQSLNPTHLRPHIRHPLVGAGQPVAALLHFGLPHRPLLPAVVLQVGQLVAPASPARLRDGLQAEGVVDGAAAGADVDALHGAAGVALAAGLGALQGEWEEGGEWRGYDNFVKGFRCVFCVTGKRVCKI